MKIFLSKGGFFLLQNIYDLVVNVFMSLLAPHVVQVSVIVQLNRFKLILVHQISQLVVVLFRNYGVHLALEDVRVKLQISQMVEGILGSLRRPVLCHILFVAVVESFYLPSVIKLNPLLNIWYGCSSRLMRYYDAEPVGVNFIFNGLSTQRVDDPKEKFEIKVSIVDEDSCCFCYPFRKTQNSFKAQHFQYLNPFKLAQVLQYQVIVHILQANYSPHADKTRNFIIKIVKAGRNQELSRSLTVADIYQFFFLGFFQNRMDHSWLVILNKMVKTIVPIAGEVGIFKRVLGASVVAHPDIIAFAGKDIRQQITCQHGETRKLSNQGARGGEVSDTALASQRGLYFELSRRIQKPDQVFHIRTIVWKIRRGG